VRVEIVSCVWRARVGVKKSRTRTSSWKRKGRRTRARLSSPSRLCASSFFPVCLSELSTDSLDNILILLTR
jgi:hypothetical protein